MEDNKEEIYIEDERTQTFPNCETNPQENIKQQEPIFVMTLELDEGNPKQIQIYADSKPGELAFEFCKENNLDFESLKQLKIQIENLMKEHTKEEPLVKEYEEKKSDDMRKEKTEVREQIPNEMMTKQKQKENSKDEHMLYHYEPYEQEILEPIEDKKEFNEHKEKETLNERVNNYTPLMIKDNKNHNNLKIQHPNETYNKSISVSKYSNNPLSRSITDTHKSSNVKKASKLFPYEFKIQDNRTNARNNRNLYKCQSTAHSKNTIGVNQSYQSLRTRFVANSNPNGVSISRISTVNSQSRSKKSIFDRLFKDSQIKRIAYRRPCHFSKTPKKRNSIVSCNNTNTSINTISLMNHYDYCSDEEYARSYQLKSSKDRIDNCSFKPNITPLSVNSPSLRKTPSVSKNNINIQSKESLVNYKPKIVEKKTLQDKDRYNNYHTINIGSNKTLLQSNLRKVNDNNSLYKPLRDRVIKSSQEESSYLEGIRNESYTNLYIALSGDENVKLSKANLNLTNIPRNIQNDIHSIVENIMKTNAVYTKEDFLNEMKEIFKTLSFEEKRNIINYYKMRINTFKQPIERNCQTPYLFNSKTSSQMNSSRKSLSCSKNKEAVRKIRNPSNKKRNFYYVF